MDSLGVAVAGAGFIGPVHVEGLRRAGLRVVGMLGVSEDESRRAAEALGLAKAYRNFDEILGDGEVDSVHIATPNRLHYGMARAALEAGKHVLCEKPLAMNSRESAHLVALAAQSKRAAGINYNIRFYPLCIEAREMVRRGDLGEVYSICGSYVQDWLLYATDYNWRVLAEEGGELRAVADIGTHWLDLIHSISALEVEAVCADLRTFLPVRKRPKGEVETFKGKASGPVETDSISIATEDHGAILLRFHGGARGCLWVSQVTAGRKNCLRFEIAGSKRAIAWESERPNELWIGRREEANACLLRDPALLSDAARRHAAYPGGHNEGFPDTFKQCFRAFYGFIEAGDLAAAPPYPTFADGHREIVLCESILRSHRENRWVAAKGGVA
ncbi:MAG: Gfo/Idh/MocA family oxidoreductase [Planctomycetes bacterium]|nr:Gfo/Idh/MocA family oxidoreductase [Planctomycetota bacterium]